MRAQSISVAVLAVLLGDPGLRYAEAGPRDFVIHVTRLGGDTASAQPYIDRFLRYLEAQASWPSGSTKGTFLRTRDDVIAAMTKDAPGVAILEPQVYLELRGPRKLEPFLQLESASLVSPKLHLVTKNTAYRAIGDLRGKSLWTILGESPPYLSKIVFDGQVDAGTHFKIKRTFDALKGVRGVLRGDCDATLLDDDQIAAAQKIDGGSALRTIYTSPALPPIPVVAVGAALPAADRATLVRVLSSMCGTKQGGEICREMHIDRFVPPDTAALNAVQSRYGQ
jgi:hypothetical protein